MATLPSPLAATQREISGTAGRLALYEAGSGSPVLLIHSINAAASAYEVRPLFERLSATHRVFAIDLPGYGTRVSTVVLRSSAEIRVVERTWDDGGGEQDERWALPPLSAGASG